MKRIIALDYGERRIGVAVSDEACIIAMPLCVIEVKSVRQVMAELKLICAEKDAGRIIVGMPLNMNGSAGPRAEKTVGFVKTLQETLQIPVKTWDERLSSKMAERSLIEFDVSRGRRKRVIDKLAAQVILQGYLDSNESAATCHAIN